MTKDEVFGILLGKEMYDTVKAKINADDCYDVVRFIVLNELGIIDDDGNYIPSVMDSIKDEIKEEVIAAICEDDAEEDDDTSPECEAEKHTCKHGHCKEEADEADEAEEMTNEEQVNFASTVIEAFSDRKLNDEEKRAIKDALLILNKAFGHDK